jgi:hypothetical protein
VDIANRYSHSEASLKINFRFYRLSIFAGAAIFGTIALVIATVVIPPVKADTFPLARPEAAATAFWVSVVLHLLIATALFLIAFRVSDSGGGKAGVLGSLAVFALLLSLALADAANAFQAHGPDLQIATTFLFICTTVGFLTAVLLIIMAFLIRKRT